MKQNYSYMMGNEFAIGTGPNKTSFKKGHIPWNKGMKGIHTSPETEFKKGERPPTWCPVGTIRKRKDKNRFYNKSGLKPMPEEVRAKYLERYIDAYLDIEFEKQKDACHDIQRNN